MKIRYYLLLVAGVITTLVFLFSFVLEGVLLRERLAGMRNEGKEFFENSFARNREDLREFVTDALARQLARVNALLDAVVKFPTLTQWFAPRPEDRDLGTWNQAATLLQEEEWVRFLQNTQDGKLLSLLIPQEDPFFPIKAIPIEEGICWMYLTKDPSKPLLAIALPVREEDLEEEFLAIIQDVPYLLYDPERIKNRVVADSEDEPLRALLQRAVAIAQTESAPALEGPFPQEEPLDPTDFAKLMQTYRLRREANSQELFLLWQVTLLEQEGILTREWMPDALAFADKSAFFLGPLLGREVFFADGKFLEENGVAAGGVCPSSALIAGPRTGQVLLVNTARLLGAGDSLLTVGVDLQEILNEVVSGFRQYVFIVHKGTVLASKNPLGAKDLPLDILQGQFAENTGVRLGTLDLQGEQYHFSSMPLPVGKDLEFFFLYTPDDEYTFFLSFQERMSKLLKMLLLERRVLQGLSLLLLWFLLMRVSKKITEPIVALSSSLEMVKKEQWDQIRLPELTFRKDNEIKVLYDSFYSMLQGMKDKEKVTSILNKVVSEEIAREILKGDVQLGGEEREVTMLFADIRSFTHLTQNMAPHEVIDLLNRCMTKFSQIIEQNHGVIDKYLGDGVMAIYGAPVALEHAALHAILSGLAMVESLKEWNQERAKEGLPPVHVGVGIHTGPVCAGNMGGAHRLNYTVIGSHVNMASRLCAAAEAQEVVITQYTYEHASLKEFLEVEDKGLHTFKGFDEQVRVYRVLAVKKGVSS